MILRYIPYIQTNFVLGLDGDMGPEPFELTKTFIDLAPGAFPAYSLLSAFGRAAPMNLDYQRAGRVLPFPFHFLNNNHAMNVRPKNYSWPRVLRRADRRDAATRSPGGRSPGACPATPTAIPKWMNVVRAMSSEGWGRIEYHTHDPAAARHRPVGAGVTWRGRPTVLPEFYHNRIRHELGPMYEYLPDGRAVPRSQRLPRVRGGNRAGGPQEPPRRVSVYR